MKAVQRRRHGVPTQFAQAPLRTVRPQDAVEVYAHPGTQMARLERLGLLHKVATGYYIVVPQEYVGTIWRPTIEGAAAGIATAAVGAGNAVLMGLSAARLHHAIPRALGVAVVAVPTDRRDVPLRDRDGLVRFVRADTELLDAELMATDLGETLVTTPEQTVLDLAHRPGLGDTPAEAAAAIEALLPRCDEAVLDGLAAVQRRRATLRRLRAVRR